MLDKRDSSNQSQTSGTESENPFFTAPLSSHFADTQPVKVPGARAARERVLSSLGHTSPRKTRINYARLNRSAKDFIDTGSYRRWLIAALFVLLALILSVLVGLAFTLI